MAGKKLPSVYLHYYYWFSPVRGMRWDGALSGTPALLLYLACACVVIVSVWSFCSEMFCCLFVVGLIHQPDLWRILVIGSLGRAHLSCYAALSFCLDGWWIKGPETVTKPRWANDIISLQCVRARGTPVGVRAPVEAWDPGDWSAGPSGQRYGMPWLAVAGVVVGVVMVSSNWRTRGAVVCRCAVRIGYNLRADQELFIYRCASDWVTSLLRSCVSPYRLLCRWIFFVGVVRRFWLYLACCVKIVFPVS